MQVIRDTEERIAIMVSLKAHKKMKNHAINLGYRKAGMKGVIEDISKKSSSELKEFLNK